MDIAKHINNLLLKHNCVILPGLGGFVANYRSAKIHPVNHTFIPPSKEIVFNNGLKHNDGVFANYLAHELNINYASALEIIEIQVNSIIESLVKQKFILLPELGKLSINNQGNISFEPLSETSFYAGSFGLSEFVSPPVIRPSLTRHLTDTIQKEKAKPQKIRRLNSNLRWSAAAIIPLLFVITWASFNIDYLKSYNLGNTELFSFLFEKDELIKINDIKSVNDINVNDMIYIYNFEQLVPVSNEPVGVNIPFKIIEEEIIILNDKENIDVIENEIISGINEINTIDLSNKKRYFIIGNCFKSLTNANIYLSQLKDKGYAEASLAGISPNGLHRVSLASYSSMEEAEKEMNRIRVTEQKDAWLLED